MALTTSLPLIDDLALKFDRHTIHDEMKLQNFHGGAWQAKDYALYLGPAFGVVDTTVLRSVVPFEFKAIGDFTTKKNTRNKTANEKASTRNSPRNSPKRSAEKTQQCVNKCQTKDTIHANNAPTENTGFSAMRRLHFDNNEACSFDDEDEDDEISAYFSEERSFCATCADNKILPNIVGEGDSTTRNHARKRSMEDVDFLATKRCRRPNLNFDKMLLNSGEQTPQNKIWCTETDAESYFRPITPQDLIS